MKTKIHLGYLIATLGLWASSLPVHAAQKPGNLIAQAGEVRPKMEIRGVTRPSPIGEKEEVTFLGVETAPVSETLGNQLGLPKDCGLVVINVMPDSPAAGALKQHDVLLKFDDQILIDARQFSVLVRNRKEGEEVTFTYLRAGKQGTAKVKLGKHEVPKMAMIPGGAFSPGRILIAGKNPNGSRDSREDMDRVLELIQHGQGDARSINTQQGLMWTDRREAPGFRAINVNPGNSSMVFTDEQGSLDLTIKDGKKTLVAKNAAGDAVFSGPVNTPEEREALAPEIRGRLNKLEGMQGFTFKTGEGFAPSTKTIRAFPQGIAFPDPESRTRDGQPVVPQVF